MGPARSIGLGLDWASRGDGFGLDVAPLAVVGDHGSMAGQPISPIRPLRAAGRVVGRAAVAGALDAAERGRLPDPVIRAGVELRLRAKLRHEGRGGPEAVAERHRSLLAGRAAGPVTTHVADANRQHYEVPAQFFERILGPRLRYACCLWPAGVEDLATAEELALAQTAARAGIVDGDRVLELGAGWGSLALFLAERFPASEIATMSNSRTQKDHIDARSRARKLTNLTVVTDDIGRFEPPGMDGRPFDRVVSVELFEHVRNHRELLRRIAGWLRPGGTCFVHLFANRRLAWHFDAEADGDWMARQFFAGGTMPSADLLLREQRHLTVVDQWWLDGTHYAKTLRAWLDRLDADRDGCRAALASGPDPTPAELQLTRWRLFLLASIGTWAFGGGREFGVGHYLFTRPPSA
jgi:cyclopropane-fatty-acyl-phospholipid synthase